MMNVAIVSNFPVVQKFVSEQLSELDGRLNIRAFSPEHESDLVKMIIGRFDFIVVDGNPTGLSGFLSSAPNSTRFILLEGKDQSEPLLEHARKLVGFIDYGTVPAKISPRIYSILKGRELWSTERIWKYLASKEKRKGAARRPLTKSEYNVGRFLAQGLMNKQIAYKLGIRESTVKAHVRVIKQKSGLDSRTQIALWLYQAL